MTEKESNRCELVKSALVPVFEPSKYGNAALGAMVLLVLGLTVALIASVF